MNVRAPLVLLVTIAAAGLSGADSKDNTRESAQQSQPAERTHSLDELSWLAGHWASEESGRVTEEHWIAPAGGLMLGVNRTVSSSGKATFEFLRIAETSEGLTYFAMPQGNPPTPFRISAADAESVTFENKEHDFPQRISYRRADGNLIARVEGTVNGKDRSLEWTWRPVAH